MPRAETNSLPGRYVPPGFSAPCRALPVIGIATGGMHRCLKTTGQRLTQLVASHEQTLTMGCARFVEFELLLIRAVIVEPVLGPPSLPFRLQCLPWFTSMQIILSGK